MMHQHQIFNSKKGHGNGLWPFFVIVLCLLTACHKPATLPLTDEDYADSTVCTSAFDSADLVRPIVVDTRLRVTHYGSQLDADTALLSGRVLGGTTSRSRLALYQRQGRAKDIEIVCPVEETWSLVICGRLRARKVKDLKGLTVATAREDASSVLCDRMAREAGLQPDELLHPQINDLGVRVQMLTNGQIDAAMLPEPYATQARSIGHRIAKTVTDTTQTVLVVRRSATPEQRQRLRQLLQP